MYSAKLNKIYTVAYEIFVKYLKFLYILLSILYTFCLHYYLFDGKYLCILCIPLKIYGKCVKMCKWFSLTWALAVAHIFVDQDVDIFILYLYKYNKENISFQNTNKFQRSFLKVKQLHLIVYFCFANCAVFVHLKAYCSLASIRFLSLNLIPKRWHGIRVSQVHWLNCRPST